MSFVSNPETVGVCIVGAGVVGLAIARELAVSGKDVLVVEQGPRFGEGVSSRNSEVIHAGIYYPADSLKAKLCVRGRSLLYAYCESRKVAHGRVGKLIVATTPAEEEQLAGIKRQAIENGVTDLFEVSSQRLAAIEPALNATMALFSPSTGIISAPELMTSLLAELESSGGTLAIRASVSAVQCGQNEFLVKCNIENQPYEFQCERLVNAAGLGAPRLAASIDGLSPEFIPPLFFCKGNYFTYQGRPPFSHLIYPVPERGGAGLGVHATIDLAGQVKFGPDVEYVDTEDYLVSDERLAQSVRAIKRYFPALEPSRLVAGYAGIRPKLQGPGDPFCDFVIQGEDSHRIPGLVNLFGIESPGLTSSMAIAETVAAHLYPQ
ncbi:MAG: NAD(P)/FAD-dependent oxidoreductase [Candidatus Azotimanducaceae bacterium WSBS_2022_MAG_OTU7]